MSVKSKLKAQIRFVNSIQGRKLTSVRKYTDEAYIPINAALLSNEAPTKACQTIIEDLDALFKSVPAIEDEIIVYRGVTRKHDFGILTGFVSTTYNYDTAISFADDKTQCCIFIITIPIGTKVLPVEDISMNPTEGEILLPRSGNFIARGNVFKNGMECFYLDLVNESSSNPRPKTPSKKADERTLELIQKYASGPF